MLSIWQFFTDPILRAPTLGTMLMCLASSLIGVIAFVKRRSLLGETLSHASYPGVVLSILFVAPFLSPMHPFSFFAVLMGAFVFAWLGLMVVEKLEKTFGLYFDATLCLVLSLFLGFGVLLASRLQMTRPIWYQKIQTFLFGQVVTIGDEQIGFYIFLCLVILIFIISRFRQIELIYFDEEFAKSLGVSHRVCELLPPFLLILALVIGIRSVGVILMSGMLIAPASFARQWTNQLGKLFFIAGVIGVISGFLGIYFSTNIPLFFNRKDPISLPTGPMILLVAVSFTFLSLLFSPRKGYFSRMLRIRRFRLQCQMDHLLKALWKEKTLTIQKLRNVIGLSLFSFRYLLFLSAKQGWTQGREKISLTADGKRKGARLVRLHRLWELYLSSKLKFEAQRVHYSAEQMEHILTPEIEEQLTDLLKDPKKDPHHQPIPAREEI